MLFNGVEYNIQFWQGEELGRTLAIDTETTVIPFTETPDLITFQVFDGENLYYVDRSLVDDFLKKHVTRTLVLTKMKILDVTSQTLRTYPYKRYPKLSLSMEQKMLSSPSIVLQDSEWRSLD